MIFNSLVYLKCVPALCAVLWAVWKSASLSPIVGYPHGVSVRIPLSEGPRPLPPRAGIASHEVTGGLLGQRGWRVPLTPVFPPVSCFLCQVHSSDRGLSIADLTSSATLRWAWVLFVCLFSFRPTLILVWEGLSFISGLMGYTKMRSAGGSFVRELNGPGDGLSVAAEVQAVTPLRKHYLWTS